MASTLASLDAHEQPSDEMRSEWKKFSRLDHAVAGQHPQIDDPRRPLDESGFLQAGTVPRSRIVAAFAHLGTEYGVGELSDVPIIYHPILPGLLIMPSLVHPTTQKSLIDRMLHRDLSNPSHETNLHLHYQLPYPVGANDKERSFFSMSPESPTQFVPKDANVHRPLTAQQVLQRRLHWVTLGGQYDWTNRVYPDREPPRFPPDIADFLSTLFPDTLAQAAIVNIYTPGDTMMMHRDVSEETDKGLISLSFGCDCLFMIAPSRGAHGGRNTASGPTSKDTSSDAGKAYLLLKLRSGDAIYMTNESRYAWHGVPKVIKGSCPDYLENWPAQKDDFEAWEGWMKNKRVNLNVRQIK